MIVNAQNLLRLIAMRKERQECFLSFWFEAIGWMVTEKGNMRARTGFDK